MHDYLFEQQDALDDNHLLKYATLGIDTATRTLFVEE
jgi:hypothetical protein